MATVIRDRRPTLQEMNASTVDGVSRWIVYDDALRLRKFDGQRHGYRYGTRINTVWAVTVADDTGYSSDYELGIDAPGEIWRPITPDGEPMTLNGGGG